jgi:hypothetical protein
MTAGELGVYPSSSSSSSSSLDLMEECRYILRGLGVGKGCMEGFMTVFMIAAAGPWASGRRGMTAGEEEQEQEQEQDDEDEDEDEDEDDDDANDDDDDLAGGRWRWRVCCACGARRA